MSVAQPQLNKTPPPGQALLIGNSGDRSIRGFWKSANGNVSPSWTITGSNTQILGIESMALDPSGNLWIGQGANSVAIIEFAHDARGNATPLTVIGAPRCANGDAGNDFLAFDPSGNMYVLLWTGPGTNCILVYAPGAKTASREIDDSSLVRPSGLVYSNGMLYTADMTSDAIDGYPASASGETSPTFQITGSATKLKSPASLGFDKDGALYVQQEDGTGTILAYDHPVSGNMAPTRTIAVQTNRGLLGVMIVTPLTLLIDAASPTDADQIETYRDIGGPVLRILGGAKTKLNGVSAMVVR